MPFTPEVLATLRRLRAIGDRYRRRRRGASPFTPEQLAGLRRIRNLYERHCRSSRSPQAPLPPASGPARPITDGAARPDGDGNDTPPAT